MIVTWSPLVVDRVGEIAKYIAKENQSAASKWIDSIFDRVNQLESFPESGIITPETDRVDIRQLIIGKYRIIYRIGKEQVSILTLRHNRQRLPEDEIGKKRS